MDAIYQLGTLLHIVPLPLIDKRLKYQNGSRLSNDYFLYTMMVLVSLSLNTFMPLLISKACKLLHLPSIIVLKIGLEFLTRTLLARYMAKLLKKMLLR